MKEMPRSPAERSDRERVARTRYERVMGRHPGRPGDIAAVFADASVATRQAIPAASSHEIAIRDVAAGVAGPALAGFTIWMLRQAHARNLTRLRFLSRDGQVLYELARRIAPRLGIDLDLEYVYSSRLTWSLAATDPANLASAEWLFNSFMKSNATDVCARLGLPVAEYMTALAEAGVSLDPETRADGREQLRALRRFLHRDDVTRAATARIEQMREILTQYANQHMLADPHTGLVDAGWTGRMAGSLIKICEQAGMGRPHILLWGHEPRATGWTNPGRVAAYMYNTASGEGLAWRVADAPFIVETFCMGDHGVVTGYKNTESGKIEPHLQADVNVAAERWGLRLYRSAVYAFCDALSGNLGGEARPLIHEVMNAFWIHPTRLEAIAWGRYPYDSDPAGTAVRPLARPLTKPDAFRALIRRRPARDDRAWLAGSAAISGYFAGITLRRLSSPADRRGAPATD